jgi:hypothetical protein
MFFAVKIKVAVVARAPDMPEISSVLNDASEMCADCSKRSQISAGDSNQYPRLAAELKDLPAVRLNISGFDRQVHSPRC